MEMYLRSVMWLNGAHRDSTVVTPCASAPGVRCSIAVVSVVAFVGCGGRDPALFCKGIEGSPVAQ